MLKSISIRNYLLIENLELSIPDGFIVLTGETGTGKSIIIDALGLILGNRLSTGIQISGDNKCVVEASFNISGKPAIYSMLHENDIDRDDVMLVRREINKTGKSRAFINDTPVNLQTLEAITSRLVDMHNQFANLEIAKPAFRLSIVDSVAGTRKDFADYKLIYSEFTALKNILNEKKQQHEAIIKEADFYEYQLKLLQESGVKSNAEYEELESELNTLMHAGEIKENLYECMLTLSKGDNDMVTQLKNCITIMTKVMRNSDMATPLKERLESLLVELKDIDSEISALETRVEVNPQRLEMVTGQIDKINSLLSRFRVNTVDELRMLENEFATKISQASTLTDEVLLLQKECDTLQTKVENAAAVLSGKRSKVFGRIKADLEEMLQSLNLNGARFEVVNKISQQPDASGIDNIDFLFSANKNMAPENLMQTASGGELSRIMLCLKSLMSSEDAIPTLIFDEIDAGVSGEIADKMGRIMQKLSVGRQVISITHLPQIAARGKSHFKVIKTEKTDRTVTSVKLLNQNERTEELASMLSGAEVTAAARANATNLLQNSL
ncbi:MAG: DNA repair protein RecN [Bacteroidales bacterium]|nr:DNA repair protein RecN [Bacteroidales bacterium]HOY38689.1 DNA repair protein RecN [Bacteroidales bacterium]HQP03776.1 DNA repair protein RecN [Bacteroidales bacterium]